MRCCSRSYVVAGSGRPSCPLSARPAPAVRIHARSNRHCVVSQASVGCPSRFAGGQRTALGLSSVLRSRSGASLNLAWAFPEAGIAGFGHEVLAVQASVSEHSARPLVSRRLKPQCVVMSPHSNTKRSVLATIALLKVARLKPWRLVTQVSASTAKRQVVQQPPNHSFKRTCLRQAA